MTVRAIHSETQGIGFRRSGMLIFVDRQRHRNWPKERGLRIVPELGDFRYKVRNRAGE